MDLPTVDDVLKIRLRRTDAPCVQAVKELVERVRNLLDYLSLMSPSEHLAGHVPAEEKALRAALTRLDAVEKADG